nr:hypothetical protein [Tanacetum cinerariifolium]
ILKKYGLNTCDIIGTPMDIKDKLDLDQIGTLVDATKYRSMIGAFMYHTSSRPDIVHATCDYGFELIGFSDADYAGCKDTFKSTYGGAQFLGKKLMSWSSKKQDCTSLSIAELEYVSLSACCTQVLWMQTQLTDYGYHFDKMPIYCDSKSTIAISCNPVQHSRTKHIAVRYHFIKEHVEKGTIELKSQMDLPKDTPIDRLEVLRYDIGKRSKVRMGIMPTKTELTLEQTQQVEHGPLLWPTVEEDGVTRLKKYSELSAAEAIQADCDVKATNIILQGLPSKVYALVSTHKVAKALWERIQMLMQGTSLIK